MGAELNQNIDPEMLENLKMMMDYESLKVEKEWPLLETLPKVVFKSTPKHLTEIVPKDNKEELK